MPGVTITKAKPGASRFAITIEANDAITFLAMLTQIAEKMSEHREQLIALDAAGGTVRHRKKA